jgi:hypothetical protein
VVIVALPAAEAELVQAVEDSIAPELGVDVTAAITPAVAA